MSTDKDLHIWQIVNIWQASDAFKAVLFHHSLTWHGSRSNESDRPRRAIAFHFMTPKTVYHAAGSHIMKSQVDVADGAMLCGVHFPELP